jgi:hypothetical protein
MKLAHLLAVAGTVVGAGRAARQGYDVVRCRFQHPALLTGSGAGRPVGA